MTPTYEALGPFQSDWKDLDDQTRKRFRAAVGKLVEDLKAGTEIRAGLRIKGVQGTSGVWELTYAPDGRATFEYGPEIRPGEVHIVWRRISSHEVLDQP
jgi:hypothetical protein